MLELTHLQELASPLIQHVNLAEIRLFESHGRHVKFQGDGTEYSWSDLGVSITNSSDADDGAAVFMMQADISLVETDSEDDPGSEESDLATFSVTYGALYVISEDLETPSREALTAFGQCVASLAMWPYIRAEMAHLTEAMHAAPLTLPMLSQRDLVELTQ